LPPLPVVVSGKSKDSGDVKESEKIVEIVEEEQKKEDGSTLSDAPASTGSDAASTSPPTIATAATAEIAAATENATASTKANPTTPSSNPPTSTPTPAVATATTPAPEPLPRTFINPPPQQLCHLFFPTSSDSEDVIAAHMTMFDRSVNPGGYWPMVDRSAVVVSQAIKKWRRIGHLEHRRVVKVGVLGV
ncbi:hypothetical protein HDU97_001372, partial [Phlyctochytrium planicorne]